MDTLQVLVLIVAAGVAAQWVASRLHVPALLLLLATGFVLGPVSGWVTPRETFGELLRPLVSLAVAIVLFEGGLSLHVREARRIGGVLWRLIGAGLVVGFASVTVLAVAVAGLSWTTAAVLGAILVVTGPTVIMPMLRGARIAQRPATLLKWEGIVNDPFGALLAILVLQAAIVFEESGAAGMPRYLLQFVGLTAAAIALGGTSGWILGRALDKGSIREDLKSAVMLGAVLAVYVAGEALQHENGLLAVTAMGMALANVEAYGLEDVRHFKEQVSTLLVAFLFVVLSADLQPQVLGDLLGPPGLLVLLVLFVARPLVALAATLGSRLPWRERLLLGWIAPRGVVAAAVAGAFDGRLVALGHEDGRLLLPIVFGVIIATVVLHGLTLRPMARALGLAARGGRGVLLVGASTWAIALAEALARAGASVAVADTRYRRVSRARQAGLEVHFGDVLSEETALELPLERVSMLLAVTPDDSYNALVCVEFGRSLGRTQVVQLTPTPTPGSVKGKERKVHMGGRTPWGEHATYGRIAERFWQGAAFKVTQLSEQFGWEALREQYPEAVFLLWVTEERVGVIADDPPPVDAKVVYQAFDREPTTRRAALQQRAGSGEAPVEDATITERQ